VGGNVLWSIEHGYPSTTTKGGSHTTKTELAN